MPVVDGRWFSREDAGQNWEAVVINAAMARDVFGTEQAAGKTMPRGNAPGRPADGPPSRPQRVVGVIEDFRQFGEYSTPGNYMFVRNDIVSASAEPAPADDDRSGRIPPTVPRRRSRMPPGHRRRGGRPGSPTRS